MSIYLSLFLMAPFRYTISSFTMNYYTPLFFMVHYFVPNVLLAMIKQFCFFFMVLFHNYFFIVTMTELFSHRIMAHSYVHLYFLTMISPSLYFSHGNIRKVTFFHTMRKHIYKNLMVIILACFICVP